MLIGIEDGVITQAKTVSEGVKGALVGKIDALLCVAGGWAGGNAKNKGGWVPFDKSGRFLRKWSYTLQEFVLITIDLRRFPRQLGVNVEAVR